MPQETITEQATSSSSSSSSYSPGKYYGRDPDLKITDHGIMDAVIQRQKRLGVKEDHVERSRVFRRQLLLRDMVGCIHTDDVSKLREVVEYAKAMNILAQQDRDSDVTGSRQLIHNPVYIIPTHSDVPAPLLSDYGDDRDGTVCLDTPIVVAVSYSRSDTVEYLCGQEVNALDYLPYKTESGHRCTRWTSTMLLSLYAQVVLDEDKALAELAAAAAAEAMDQR